MLRLALPGIITGMALSSFFTFAGIPVLICTIVIRHDVLRGRGLQQRRCPAPAQLDLAGGGVPGSRRGRLADVPVRPLTVLSTALVAGGLLAFALSFDDVIVTTFTAGLQETAPLFILDNIRQGQELPVINVVAFVVIVIPVIPSALAQRLMRNTGVIRRGRPR